MSSFKMSDKTKVMLVLAIALFEIAFINFTKDKPKIETQETLIVKEYSNDQVVIVNSNDNDRGLSEEKSEPPVTIAVEESLKEAISNEAKELAVHFMDVGQADAVYIGYGDFDMVIDGGNNEDGPFVVNYLEDKVTGPIEMVIGSHAHEDHIGGLDDVMAAYPIKMIVDSGEVKDTRTYEDYMVAAQKSGGVIMEDATRHYDIDNQFSIDIIEAVDGEKNTNNNSIVVKLTYNEVSFLFTGDLEEEIESSLLTENIKADVFKAGHHGSSTSNSDMFLRRVQPEMIIISAGANNKYGHPHAEALSRMKKHTDQIFGTWENGSIIVRTDGIKIQTDAVEIVTMDDANASGTASESDAYNIKKGPESGDWWKDMIKPSKKKAKKKIEDAVTEALSETLSDIEAEKNEMNEVIVIEIGE